METFVLDKTGDLPHATTVSTALDASSFPRRVPAFPRRVKCSHRFSMQWLKHEQKGECRETIYCDQLFHPSTTVEHENPLRKTGSY